MRISYTKLQCFIYFGFCNAKLIHSSSKCAVFRSMQQRKGEDWQLATRRWNPSYTNKKWEENSWFYVFVCVDWKNNCPLLLLRLWRLLLLLMLLHCCVVVIAFINCLLHGIAIRWTKKRKCVWGHRTLHFEWIEHEEKGIEKWWLKDVVWYWNQFIILSSEAENWYEIIF